MFPSRRVLQAACALLVGVMLPSRDAAGQGVTTAAVYGRVTDNTGRALEGAAVVLTNATTGQRYEAVARTNGAYTLENVAVGGPYSIEARQIGFQPAPRGRFRLSLGQRLELNLTMQQAAIRLDEILVTAQEQDPLYAPSRTGTEALIADTAVARLPTLNRNFTDFVITMPQVASAGGLTMGGGHRKYNSIQIDGVSDNDLFGLGDTGQPGGPAQAKSITLEAVKEYQVLIAPFDVRQSGFAGGLINAITKRGSNTFHGGGFFYLQNESLVRDTLPANGTRFGEYKQNQIGFSLSGPIVRNRAHFFTAVEWQDRSVPISGNNIGTQSVDQVGITEGDAQRFVDLLSGYGVNGGGYRSLPIETPNRNIFARLDFQLGANHDLTLRHNHVHGEDQNLSRSQTQYRLTSNGYAFKSNTNSTVAQLNSTFGGGNLFNELRVGVTIVNDVRDPESPFPQIDVETSTAVNGTTLNGVLRAGAEQFSQLNSLDQRIIEVTDDVTIPMGDHTLTIGTHDEVIHFDNKFFHSSIGVWQFDTLDDFAAGTASSFFRQIPFDPARGAPIADWNITQLGFYAQDRWSPSPRVGLTAGMRVDIPLMNDTPVRNEDVEGSSFKGQPVRTDQMPSGNLLFSPRLGLNVDLTGTRSTVFRGGAGLFTGRPAYVWLSNAYTNTGREVSQVSCAGATVPAFTADADNQPTQCAGGGGISTPTSQVNVFDKSFRFPQSLKVSAAIDQKLPGDVLGTVEFLYTRGINNIRQVELNIPQSAISVNSEGREMFGTGSAVGAGAQRVNAAFNQVLMHTNHNNDRTLQLTLDLQKTFANGLGFSAGYTYSDVKDEASLTSSIATSNYGFRPVSQGGNPNDAPLSTSWYSVPHKLNLSGTVNLPVPDVPSSLTLIYVGQSGQPYTWTVDGDANGDGYEGPGISSRNNDIVYVPTSAADFTGETPSDFDNYNTFIASESCLQEARGTIPERNTCRNPWQNRFDASLRVSVGRTLGGPQWHNLTFIWDVFNVLNLLNSDWGVTKGVSFFETRELLDYRGYDAANDRPIYRWAGPAIDAKQSVFDLTSRWRMQLGLRYAF
jgi:Carboxypeptidase regulatory-like domain